MNCLECLDLLQRRLDGDAQAESVDLERHLSECADCRARHGAVPQLAEGLRLLASPLPPAGLSNRIVNRVLAEHRGALSFQRRLIAAAAIAAGLLLASGVALQIFRPAGNGGPDESQLV